MASAPKPAKYWLAHVEAWRQSGLNQSDYCKKHKIKPYCLSYWQRKFPHKKAESSFVPVVVDSGTAIVIELPRGVKVSVSSKSDPSWLALLLKKLA